MVLLKSDNNTWITVIWIIIKEKKNTKQKYLNRKIYKCNIVDKWNWVDWWEYTQNVWWCITYYFHKLIKTLTAKNKYQ